MWPILVALVCWFTGASGDLSPVVLINAGSTVSYEDTKGNVWSADTNTDGRTPDTDPSAEIADTEDDELYRQFRDKLNSHGSLHYNISLPNDTYTVELHFADLYRKRVGQRVFDIYFDNVLIRDDYDPILNAGSNFDADVQKIENVAITDGVLNIEFSQGSSHAMISAIGIYKEDIPLGTSSPSTSVSDTPSTVPSDEPTHVTPTTAPSTPSISDEPSNIPTIEPWGEATAPTPHPTSISELYQPRVINVEAYPAHKAHGFIGWPGGTIWCQGRATYWWSGHDNRPEEPFCEEADGTWTKSSTAVLDRQDDLNILDGPVLIDRHDCVAFDANSDGIEDIICVVGDDTGTGVGWNEVYYTQPDGSIEREMDDVGLYKYPTMRTRWIQNLTSADGGDMIVLATTGGPRTDGEPNEHRMFRLNATHGFEETMGPFNDDFQASCLEVADINNDGIDDIIICDNIARSRGYIQNSDSTWTEVNWSSVAEESLEAWNGARVADVTGDGLGDLILAGPAYAWLGRNPDPYVRVYPGKAGLDSVFDFDNPVLDDTLPFEAMDVEVIDLNDDGFLDIYVVQWNFTSGRGDYCQQTWNYADWWEGNHDYPPADFVPPGDTAPDYLYLSVDGTSWDVIVMEHSVPGCGTKVKKWGEQSLAVAHGELSRPGFNVILDWSPAPATPAPTASRPPSTSPSLAPTSVPTSTFMPTRTSTPTSIPTSEPTTIADVFQPRIINVEAYPPHKAMGFIGWPGGTIWCQGRATYWWTGHDNRPEEPFCEEADGTWTKSSTAVLNRQDELNVLDGPVYVDRHDCVAFDANVDGIEDVICVVGANSGTGTGWNEVYYTQPNGTIVREMNDVGLYKYPTMRTRLIQNLTAADGGDMVMIVTTGGPRTDGATNAHRLFRLNATNGFDEVDGPFIIENEAVCLTICDINNDGIDDMVICDEKGPATAYVQNSDNTWTELDWSSLDEDTMEGWNGARVADVTGDGLADLLVAGPAFSWLVVTPDPYFRVFPGKVGLDTVFDFANPVIDDTLPYQAMDVEVIDLNDDGLLDMYVVQWNYTNGQGDYCQQTWDYRDWWEGNHDFPPDDFVPPPDVAPDTLYLSIDGASWDSIVMEHALPGCGSKVRKWGEKSLALAHGSFGRPGHNVILDWTKPEEEV